jgi:DNA-binding transcriptional LysR family regulator
MRLEQLEYLVAITRLGSFRRVGAENFISQPALSETMTNLERELGVKLLERRRSGVRISDDGRELLPHVTAVLEAVDQLRAAAGEQRRVSRMVRLGTVNAATVPLTTPAIREFRETHRNTQVEVATLQQSEIHQGILEGRLDLGLVNLLVGDDVSVEIESTELLRGRVVVCMRSDHPLANYDRITVDQLSSEPLIGMRSGYLMHRFMQRLFLGTVPTFSYSTDGAEMGKLLVSQGLGLTVLPEYSVSDDPLERLGVITSRPIAGDETEVQLVLQCRRLQSAHRGAVRDLHQILVDRARSYALEQEAEAV